MQIVELPDCLSTLRFNNSYQNSVVNDINLKIIDLIETNQIMNNFTIYQSFLVTINNYELITSQVQDYKIFTLI